MRRTRILATIGPATSDPATIRAVMLAGADAFRLNFSHGTISTHTAMCRAIRAEADALQRPTAILQDLAGPKIRIGALSDPLTLAVGDPLIIEQGDGLGEPGRIFCAFAPLFSAVSRGQRLLVDDGRIELEVVEVSHGRLSTRVVSGGRLDGRKGVHVPGGVLKTGALTPKDHDDLRAGLAMGVDLVALSFVQSASDISEARAIAASAGVPDVPIIAKIERPRAVDAIDEIATAADGVMVARGDLGIELPLETIPAVQKRVIQAARRRGVPVILATEVLESMRVSPRPTRAEVTDAAHAVDEGVDAIMLAGETAMGQFPVRAVSTLAAIIDQAESAMATGVQIEVAADAILSSRHGLALCEAAVTLAGRAGAVAIVAVTKAGMTARLLSALRPRATILAATPDEKTAARLALVWGVTPVVTEAASLAGVRDTLLARALVRPGDTIVFVAMQKTLGREGENFLHVEQM